jgi:hypothetical protein
MPTGTFTQHTVRQSHAAMIRIGHRRGVQTIHGGLLALAAEEAVLSLAGRDAELVGPLAVDPGQRLLRLSGDHRNPRASGTQAQEPGKAAFIVDHVVRISVGPDTVRTPSPDMSHDTHEELADLGSGLGSALRRSTGSADEQLPERTT